jgi:hypothetical protein
MDTPFPSGEDLGRISTEWSLTFDSINFIQRYAPAIQKYLLALLKNQDDAEEVAQNFFLWVTQHGFPRARKDRGRFRDYLKVTVRNAALNYVTRKKAPERSSVDLSQFPAESQSIPDREWIVEWRQCLLEKAWQGLKEHQDQAAQSWFYDVLQLKVANPEADSKTLAERASTLLGKPMRPDAFRKQLSRARHLFAELLVKEIAQTLDRPTPQQIEEELVDLGLMSFVRDFLPIRAKSDPSR